ncbi:DUF2612 domain-containing protein [Burkholderia territorii]|uniref:DUF2612 domain-containing protein n=1 Tax=Burkholderia territorii TaxID=1503055 RepID=UPI000AED3C71|nr:DUF2612 domain-containing protein [Burkholderia territorii]
MNGVISTPLQFGIGDGATTTFELASNPGEQIAQIVIANIFRADWQGNQQLYATPRTNLATNSQGFDKATWTKNVYTMVPSAAVAPDGTNTAQKLTDTNTTSGIHSLISNGATSLGIGAQACASVYAQAGDRPYLVIRIQDATNSNNYCYAVFNLQTGVVLQFSRTGAAAGVSAAMQAFGNGWYRCYVSGVPNPAATGVSMLIGAPLTNTNSTNYTGVAGQGIYVWGAQIEAGAAPTSYIATTSAAVTVTDYVLGQANSITIAPAPLAAAVLSWTGTYIYTPVDLPSNFPLSTVISQYANSPTLLQLIENFSQYIDPSADIDAFYDMVWNIDSAVGRGLDIWGKIVGLESGRLLKIPSAEINLGFKEAGNASAAPFGSGVFYSGNAVTENYYLADSAFRTLILVKAMANISDGSIPSYNQLLQNLFKGRGRCYVNDLGNMQMRYTFEFYLQPFEIAILTQSGAMPRPTGVLASIMQVPVPNIFGFSEAGKTSVAPFGQGTFFTGVLNAS